jgi:hypothetical protein
VTARRARCLGAIALAFAACGESTSSAPAEIAAELRAMRLALAARDTSPVGVEALRARLVALAEMQRTSEARQAELQRELAAWTQKLANEADAARAAEVRQLRARFDELDAALQQQRVRQSELEHELLQGLDRATKQLDGMLDRAIPPAGAEPGEGERTPPPPARIGGATEPPARPNGAAGAPRPGAKGTATAPGTGAARSNEQVPAGAHGEAGGTPPSALEQAPSPIASTVAVPAGRSSPSNQVADAGITSFRGPGPSAPRAEAADAVWRPAHAAGGGRSQAVWFALAAVGALSACWWIRREVRASRQLRATGPGEGVPTDSIATFEQLAAPPMATARFPVVTPQARAALVGSADLGPPEVVVGRPADCVRWRAALANEPLALREPPPAIVEAGGHAELRYWTRPDASAAARLRLHLRLLRRVD